MVTRGDRGMNVHPVLFDDQGLAEQQDDSATYETGPKVARPAASLIIMESERIGRELPSSASGNPYPHRHDYFFDPVLCLDVVNEGFWSEVEAFGARFATQIDGEIHGGRGRDGMCKLPCSKQDNRLFIVVRIVIFSTFF